MNKKKILLVVPLPPPMHGSNLMNQYVVSCRELYEKYTVKVLPLHYATSIADIGAIRVKKIFTLGGYIAQLLKLMVTFRPDAVYFVPAITGMSFYRDCLFALIFKCFGIHVMYHLHGKGIKHKLDSPFLFRLYRWFFQDATVIHLSPSLYEDIQGVVPINRCTFLPNGIEDLYLDLSIKEKHSNVEPVILFLSNLVPSKGPVVLLEACRFLKDKGLEFKTYFVGNPSTELTQEIFSETIDRLDLYSCVEYIGPRYGKDKYEILNQSDILVFPTYFSKEAFPLILLEAMAAGLPVVSTREGAIPEIIDDGVTGFIIDKQNPGKLAEKLECLISNLDQAKKMGQAGRAKFEQNYTIEKFYHNLVEIFNEVMGAQDSEVR
ncbi:MAG: glycosyltransferase family 4 protein [Deltaproteobacteria bacterium]|nr:glycosyltransferase family 4 protein [Deltaproteobacteria bacterium]